MWFGANGKNEHDITVALANESSQTGTVNGSPANHPNGTTVQADIDGEVVGSPGSLLLDPSNPNGHPAELLVYVNGGSTAAATIPFADFTIKAGSGLSSTGVDANKRQHILFSTILNLAVGEETSTIEFQIENPNSPINPSGTPPNPVTPISGWMIKVDTIAPRIATVGPVVGGTGLVGSVPLTLTEATTSTIDFNSLSLTRNGTSVPLNSSVVVTPNGPTAYTISGLSGFTSTPGSYVLTVNGAELEDAAGNVGASSLAATFTVQPPPPLVTMTNLQIVHNKKHLITQITVDFSGALDMTEANNPATYQLAIAGKKHSFDAKNARLLKLKRAVYIPAQNSVVLTPKKAFALTKPVQLRVLGVPPGGLEDSLGRFIDGGHGGQPGSNALALLTRGGVTLNDVVLRGD
jgi:hypothetical protein